MTCIAAMVGRKGCLIAGDAQGSTDWIKRFDVSAKVHELLPTLCIGYCGSGRFGDILKMHLTDTLEDPYLPIDDCDPPRDEYYWLVKEFIPLLRGVAEDHGHLHIHHNVEEFGPSAFVIAVRRRLFTVESDFGVNEHRLPFEAIGSGAETAAGVIHAALADEDGYVPEEPVADSRMLPLVTKAIRAAEKLTLYVGGPITHVKTVEFTPAEKALAKRILGK